MRRVETPEGRSVRLLRIGEQVRHVLSELLQRGDVHDETLQSHLVSITEVRMSPDLRHATVFVKPLLGQDEEDVLKALRQNTAFLQREVAHRIRQALLLVLGSGTDATLSPEQRSGLTNQLLRIYRDDVDSGVRTSSNHLERPLP